jgi:ribose 5-phosphate isomerase A
MSTDVVLWKRLAAEAAVEFVESGMVVGLGHGSTAVFALYRIAELLKSGALENILGVPCSRQVAAEADRQGIPLTTLEEHPVVDLTIDGADEVSDALDVIKGGGGALVREKIVAQASRREIIVADGTKTSPLLGTKWALPVEVLPFGWKTQATYLEQLGATVRLRTGADGSPFVSDQGNFILDANFGQIEDPGALGEKLDRRTGIIGHGLFLDLVTDVIVADGDGVRHMRRS